MADLVKDELRALGFTEVIAVLKDSRTSGAGAKAAGAGPQADVPKSVAKHFMASERSQAGELAAAATHGESLRFVAGVSTGRSGRGGAQKAKAVPSIAQAEGPLYFPNLGLVLGVVNQDGLAALRNDASVDTVLGTPTISLIRPTNASAARLTAQHTWGIEAMNVPRLWAQGLTGKGVLIAHLDTGADGRHPALKAAITHFAEFDALGRQVQPAPAPFDSDDHGTHTAGTIAGRPVRGRHIGVAPGASLASAVVIEGGRVVARILGGMDWAISNGARIINMSLGLRGYVNDFLRLTQILRDRGLLPVMAVGNEGPGTSRSPGNYAEALSVGAHDRRWSVAGFSSSQRFKRRREAIVPDLVGPGVDVISAKPRSGYQFMSGTSMATPHIAGLAALLMEAKPQATIDDVERAIFKSCDIRAGMIAERANRGAPDAVRALSLL